MARILTSLPGRYATEEFSAKRIVSQLGVGTTAKIAMDTVAENLKLQISAAAPVDTGDLQASVAVKAVLRGPNPRIEVKTLTHGQYQEHGTKLLPPNPFIAPAVKTGRAEWEADARETKARLDKQTAAAEKKEKSKGRAR